MRRLSHSQFGRLADSLLKIYSFSDEGTWHAKIADLIPTIIKGEGVLSAEAFIPLGNSIFVMNEGATQPRSLFGPAVMEAIAKYNTEDPLAQYFLKTENCKEARMRSDFVGRKNWEKSPLYNEVYRPTCLSHTASLTLEMRSGKGGQQALLVVVHRQNGGKDFSESDRSLLTLLRPHLLQSKRTAALIAQLRTDVIARDHAVEQAAGGILAVTKDGKVKWATPAALQLTAEFFGPVRRERLPESLERWYIQNERFRSSKDQIDHGHYPLFTQCRDKAVEIHHLCLDPSGMEPAVPSPLKEGCLLLFKVATRPTASRLKALGLRQREAEVLHWVAEGKTNPEIAIVLGISQRTVQKHLERVFKALGVETRTAAAIQAREVFG